MSEQSPENGTPPCPACGYALTAAYDDGHPFWECDGCGRDHEPHHVIPPEVTA